jgi:glutathione S-transferase
MPEKKGKGKKDKRNKKSAPKKKAKAAPRPLLVLGNKNYSSWSLRPWLAFTQAEIDFDEEVVPMFEGDHQARVRALVPGASGKVPALRHGDQVIWDSLSILEYAAETYPKAKLWPKDAAARARARSISAEMHSGFTSMREHMSMNVRRRIEKPIPPEARADVARIAAIWSECRRQAKEGPFLFGRFSIADAMFAPVAFRLRTYGVAVEGEAAEYRDALLGLPAMQAWDEAARAEAWVIERYEPAKA